MAAHHAIEKLTDSNYESWKLQMKSVLILNDLWQYVSGKEKRTQENAEAWENKDQKALAHIVLSVSDPQLNYVKEVRTSRKAWTVLETAHESKRRMKTARLCRQLYKLKKGDDQSMTEFVTVFQSKAEELEEAGIMVPQELLSIMLLNALPTQYDGFCVPIELKDKVPSIDVLKVVLVEEEARQRRQLAAERRAKNTTTVDISTEELRKEIIAVLKDADLVTMTAKKVRLQIEEKLDIDLTGRRAELDRLVMEILQGKQDEAEKKKETDSEEIEDGEEEEEEGFEEEEEEEGLGKSKKKRRIREEEDDDALRDAYTRVIRVSPELAAVIGAEHVPVHQIIIKIWSIIEERNLYDPKNQQFVICDDELANIFGIKRFKVFDMMKYLKRHFED